MKKIPITKKKLFIAIIGIFIFSTMLYWQTAFFDFVWDDGKTIVLNQKTRSLSLALTTFYKKAERNNQQAESTMDNYNSDAYSAPLLKSEAKFYSFNLTSGNWRPLRTIAHAVVYKFFKLETFWYHLLNIIGHGLVAVVLFLLLLQLTKDMLSAIAGTLLFAVHPVNTEVVCWAKSFEDLLATMFLLVTFNLVLLLNVKHSHKRNIIFIMLAGLVFALALSSKLSALFFPIFLILFFLYNRFKVPGSSLKAIIKIGRWPLIISIILLLESIAAVITRSLVLGHTAHGGYITGNCWTTWLSMPRIFLRYLWLQVLPYPLFSDYHSYPFAKTISDLVPWLYTIVFIIVFVALSWLFYRKKLLAPWLWFWCALIPFANIIAMNSLGAERFLYIPTIALAWLAAELFNRYTNALPEQREQRTRNAATALAIIIVIFAVMTINRSKTWSSSVTLYETTTEQFPDSYRPRYNLVVSYISLGQPDKALAYADKLLRKYPTFDSWTIYAQTLCMTGDYNQGVKILQKQRNNVMLNRIGIYAAKHGRLNEAERCFRLALIIAPDNPRYKKNLALLQRQRKYMQQK
ncbi:MAG: hypothetical protein L3J71_10075 [Victivallaceae bacterium]|nr:hypothetical protein [Victivallaceae bacterium]